MTTTNDLANRIEQLDESEKSVLAEFVDALSSGGESEAVAAFKDGLTGSLEERREAKEAAFADMDLEEQKKMFLTTENQREQAREREERLDPS